MFRVFEENNLWYVQNCKTEEVVYCAESEDEAMEVAYNEGIKAGTIKVNNTDYTNEKGYRVCETRNYRRTFFVETKYNAIVFIENLEDHEMDRIKIVRYGSIKENRDADIISVYRFDDSNFVNGVVNSFMNNKK